MASKTGFFRNNILMFSSTAVGNFANLLCQIVIVKKLSTADYGSFNSLLSVFTIISLPITAVNTMIVKFTASHNSLGEKKEADFFLFILLRHMFFIGAAFLAAYLFFGASFKDYLKLDSVVPVYLTGAMLFVSILSIVPQGGLQGLQRFSWFSASIITNALCKLFFAFLFLTLGYGVAGALGGYLAAYTIVLGLGLFLFREIFYVRQPPRDIGLKEKYKFVIPSIITLGCIALLTNIDIIFVKHFFSAAQAGQYSVAQIIGKIVLFVPAAIPLVMFPGVSGLHARQEDSRHLLKRSLKYGAFLCAGVIIVYNAAPGLILNILTGKTDAEVIFLGRLFSVASTFFTLTGILLLYQLSISSFKFLKSLVLVSALEVILIYMFHRSPAQVLLIMFANTLILFVLNLRSALAAQRKP